MTSGKIVWENLPTVVRRKFGDYLMRTQGKFPQAVFQRTGEPWREDKYIVIPYTDRRSGAIYEAVATEDGTVLETRDREAVNAEQVAHVAPGSLLLAPREAASRADDVLCVFDEDQDEPGAFFALVLTIGALPNEPWKFVLASSQLIPGLPGPTGRCRTSKQKATSARRIEIFGPGPASAHHLCRATRIRGGCGQGRNGDGGRNRVARRRMSLPSGRSAAGSVSCTCAGRCFIVFSCAATVSSRCHGRARRRLRRSRSSSVPVGRSRPPRSPRRERPETGTLFGSTT